MVVRLLALLVVVLGGLGLAAVLPRLPGSVRERSVRRWFAAVLAVLGVRLTRCGPARFGSGVLVVANHVSGLDVVAIGAVQPVRMLAKREVGGWPVVGVLAARAGTIFLDRDRLCSLPAVGVFPEGTTWCGTSGGSSRPAVFQAALGAGAAVRPVALHYRLSDGRSTTAATFLGTERWDLRCAGSSGSAAWSSSSTYCRCCVLAWAKDAASWPAPPAAPCDRRCPAIGRRGITLPAQLAEVQPL